jgi:phospholipid/cholesterol/gamma-HCH transport system permease protein
MAEAVRRRTALGEYYKQVLRPGMKPAIRGLERAGRATLLLVAILKVLPRPRTYFRSAVGQAYIIGIKSLPLVMFIAMLGGAVTSQQSGAQFTGGLPLWVIGSVLAASVLTELGPLLTAIVMMARVGASIAAELASMHVTEQIGCARWGVIRWLSW